MVLVAVMAWDIAAYWKPFAEPLGSSLSTVTSFALPERSGPGSGGTRDAQSRSDQSRDLPIKRCYCLDLVMPRLNSVFCESDEPVHEALLL
jgi:hypothetical protein